MTSMEFIAALCSGDLDELDSERQSLILPVSFALTEIVESGDYIREEDDQLSAS